MVLTPGNEMLTLTRGDAARPEGESCERWERVSRRKDSMPLWGIKDEDILILCLS